MQRHNSTICIAILLAALGTLIQTSRAQEQSSPRVDFLRLIDRARVPPAPDVAALPSSGRFTREHFSFSTEARERVPGITVKLAKSSGRRPAVIVMHGTGDSKEGMVPLLEALADRGLLAVAIDGRHHGDRALGPNDYVRAIL